MRDRSIRLAILVVITALIGGQEPSVANAASSSPPTCTLTNSDPVLAELMVSQGVAGSAGYTTLGRGKETLVKGFLTLPCAPNTKTSDYVRITYASLTVTQGTDPNTLITGYASKPALTATTPQPNAPIDPIFVVPSSNLAPAGADGPFDATFTLTLTFDRKIGTTTQTGQTKPYTPGTTRSFERKTNALRIYLVPMGDGHQPYSTQYTSADQAIVQSAMQAVSRMYPTPAGVTDLTVAAGGVRYVVDTATMVDLRAIIPSAYVLGGGPPSVEKFCGTSLNFNAIKGVLAQYLLTHNNANPTASADRVLGVVSGSISWGAGDPVTGCADGMASASSAEAWVRLVPDDASTSPAKPSRSGATAAQEILHTFGLTNTPSYHSANIEADGGTNRSYNVSQRGFIAADHTVMNFNNTGSLWNNDTTLLEAGDFAALLCKLTPLVTAVCLSPANIGTANGVPAAEQYVIAGTTNGTKNGTAVIEPYYTTDTAETPNVPDSLLKLVQLDATTSKVINSIGVSWSPAVTHGAVLPDPLAAIRTFYAAAPFTTQGAGEVRLVKVANPTDDPLGPNAITLFSSLAKKPPVITEISGAAIPPSGGTTTLFRSQITPVIPPKPDIVFLADTTGSMGGAIDNVKTNVGTIMSQVLSAQPNAQFAVASYKDKEFCTGDAYMFELEQALTGVTANVQTAVNSWSALGGCDIPESQLNALYRLGIGDDGADPAKAVGYRDGSSRVIAWFGDAPGHDPSNGHSLQAAIDALKAKGIRVVAVNLGGLDSNSLPGPGNMPGCATDCSGQATKIANDTGGVVKINDASQVSDAILAGLHDLRVTVQPSYNACGPVSLTFDPASYTDVTGGTRVDFIENVTVAAAFAGTYTCRVFFKINGQILEDANYFQDISVVVTDQQQRSITVKATSAAPADLLLDLIYECASFNFVAAVAVKPASQTATEATFTANADTTNACAKFGGGGALVPYVSDGWNRVKGIKPSETPSQPKPPTASITSPALGVPIVFDTTLSLRGSGEVAGQELPATALTWSIKKPDGTTLTPGPNPEHSNVVDVPAPPGGWTAGVWTAILTVTSEGGTATATRQFGTGRPSPFGP